MVVSCQRASKGARFQREILQRGQPAHGRVLKVWRPPIMGGFTRVYFEFQPVEADGIVQSCHVVHRGAGEWAASLPAVGAKVSVRYLPERPRRAVITKLVSRLTD